MNGPGVVHADDLRAAWTDRSHLSVHAPRRGRDARGSCDA